jgi:hypothetical protein
VKKKNFWLVELIAFILFHPRSSQKLTAKLMIATLFYYGFEQLGKVQVIGADPTDY